MINNLTEYLTPNEFSDSTHKDIIDFTRKHSFESKDSITNTISLYLAIRDGFWYNPHHVSLQRLDYQASKFLKLDSGHCIDKANLLATCAKVIGIPSRLGFANVTNHIGTEKVEKALGTNILVFHGYTELFLNGKWLKATPAFNAALCKKLNVKPLEFDGKTDSVFQQFSENGTKFMEYLHDYGTFAELPFDIMISEWKKHYPQAFIKASQEKLGIIGF
jgi:transglutaminase-like putative cysteine protease